MKYVIAPRNLSLKVSQNILDEMYSKAFASFPNETGGMFAGRISEDSHEAIVERLVMPSKTESMLKTEDIHPPKTGISVHFSGSLV